MKIISGSVCRARSLTDEDINNSLMALIIIIVASLQQQQQQRCCSSVVVVADRLARAALRRRRVDPFWGPEPAAFFAWGRICRPSLPGNIFVRLFVCLYYNNNIIIIIMVLFVLQHKCWITHTVSATQGSTYTQFSTVMQAAIHGLQLYRGR